MTLESYDWARAIIATRAIYLAASDLQDDNGKGKEKGGEGDYLELNEDVYALMPFGDWLNHGLASKVPTSS